MMSCLLLLYDYHFPVVVVVVHRYWENYWYWKGKSSARRFFFAFYSIISNKSPVNRLVSRTNTKFANLYIFRVGYRVKINKNTFRYKKQKIQQGVPYQIKFMTVGWWSYRRKTSRIFACPQYLYKRYLKPFRIDYVYDRCLFFKRALPTKTIDYHYDNVAGYVSNKLLRYELLLLFYVGSYEPFVDLKRLEHML